MARHSFERKFLNEYKAIIQAYGIFAEKLVRNAAFMAGELEVLKENIKNDGTKIPYQNGKNQNGITINPDCNTYNTMIKNYNATVKQLREMMDKIGDTDSQGDALDEFLSDS